MIKDGIIISDVVNGKKIGIDNYEVAQVIGVGSVDAGTLCTSKNVNKRSKYKPIGSTLTRDLTDDDYKSYTEGSVKKPYGMLMATPWIGEYDAGIETSGEQTDPSVLNKASVWEYSQPEVSDTQIGTFFGQPVYGTKNGYRCRLSDFEGYAHGAEDLFNVKWTDSTGKGQGVKCVVTLGSKAGGLTLADMGLSGCYLSLIVMSESEYAIKETGREGRRYLIGGMDWNTKLLHDTTKTYEFSLNELYLSQVLDNILLFLVVTDAKLTYDLYYESFHNGVGVNPDGWKANNAVFFPKMTATTNKRVMVENSAIKLVMNAGNGNVLWVNGNINNYSTTEGSFTYEGNGIKLNSLNEDLTVKITQLGYTDSRSSRRKFSVTKGSTGQNYAQYLNDINYTSSTGLITSAVMYKPLLRDVKMKGGAYSSVSFYIKFVLQPSVYDATASIIARYVDISGNATERTLESGKWNVHDAFGDGQRYMYHSISFANVVSPRNEVTGFKMTLNYGVGSQTGIAAGKSLTVTDWIHENDIHHHPMFPVVVMKAGNPDEVDNYGDIHIGLPDGMSAGNDDVIKNRIGPMSASFEVLNADEQSSIGV